MLSDFAHWLKDSLSELGQFFIDMFMLVLDWIWAGFMSLLDALPIASTLEQAVGLFSAVPSGVWYFLNIMSFPFGMTTILSAYLIRFFIRRLPIIG